MKDQQSEEEFEAQTDQLMTYSFSDHIPPPTAHLSNRPIKKIDQKPSLNIIKVQKQYDDSFMQNRNKNASGVNLGNRGKVIKIGQAVFKSNFECGNIDTVSCTKHNTYKISTERQVNSNRVSAWFYFRCEGLKGQVNFVVTGFTKTTSLYNDGMKICYRQLDEKAEWKRGGSKISYVSSPSQQDSESTRYQLRYTHYFKNSQSFPIEFSYCFPYQYTRIKNLCKQLSLCTDVNNGVLGKTYESKQIPILTIGNPQASKSIVLSARVHPGQTVSSFVMQGFLKQLVSQSVFAVNLRNKYLFKVVPMINPDGVVRGNYRFSAAGYDLNRRWKNCYQTSHPQIFYLKNMIKKLNKQKKVIMYIDLHGHSRKKNAFFYGCGSASNDQQLISKPKEFPFLMEKLNQNFKYQFCTFSASKDKQGTARVAMWKQLKIHHVYTLQSTFCGSVSGKNFLEKDYLELGKSLLEGISIFFYDSHIQETPKAKGSKIKIKGNQISVNTEGKNSIMQQMVKFKQSVNKQLKSNALLLNMGTKDDSGSDSDPQCGFIPQIQRQTPSNSQKLDLPYVNQKSRENKEKRNSPNYESTKKSIKINLRQTPSYRRRNDKFSSNQLKNIVQERMDKIQSKQIQPFEKEIIAKTVSNFYSSNSQQLNSLTSDSLMQRNQRVHSKQMSRQGLQRIKKQRINSQNHNILSTQNDQDQQTLRIQSVNRFLLKTRQGAQYRRVKKIAEQMKRKNQSLCTDPPIPIVRGITTMNNELCITKKNKTIAPSFYPRSEQRSRKFSAEVAFKYRTQRINTDLSSRKFYINGDQMNVHCKGKRICF